MSSLVRFTIAFLLICALVCGGTLGYMFIENWTFGEGLYMTFITLTTVGFGEVRPLSAQGRHFTILFLFLCIVTFGYSLTTVIAFIFEGQVVRALRERRMKRLIRRLKDHYIICGCGVVGREVAMEFKRARVRFAVVDRDPAQSELSRDESITFIQGSAEDDEVLLEAGIKRARGLIAALPDDESNVFVVLTARQLNPSLSIIAKASDDKTIRKLEKAGADRVVSLYQIVGRRMASVILRPSLVSFLDVVVGEGNMSMRIEEVVIGPTSPLIDKNLKETGIGQYTGAIVVGINGPDGSTRVNPSTKATLSSVVLQEGDVLLALGSDDQLHGLKEFVRKGS